MWNENAEYDENCVIVPVQSVFGGVIHINPGIAFSNIIGSANDPRPEGHRCWIDFIRGTYKKWQIDSKYGYHCSTDSFFYDPVNNSAICNAINEPYTCGKNVQIVGGHILDSPFNQEVAAGNTVYKLPICGAHNTMSLNYGKPGCGFYMRVNFDSAYAIALKNYQS